MNNYRLRFLFSISFLPFIRAKNLLWLYGFTRNKLIKRFCIFKLHKWGVSISKGARISPEAIFPHPQNIVIGRGAQIEKGARIYQGVTLGLRDGLKHVSENEIYDYYPKVCPHSVVYANSVLIGNIEIGEKAIVGANSFVNSDVKSGITVVGTPACEIKKSLKKPISLTS